MTRTIEIINVAIVTEDRTMESGSLFMDHGVITNISEHPVGGADTVIDGKGNILIPGFIDVHIHGANGHDVMDATMDSLDGIASQLPKEGTTSFLATTMTQSWENISNAVTNVGKYIGHQTASGLSEILGIHLEGPFVSTKKAGAQPIDYIAEPSIDQFEYWQQESNQSIKLVTLAPEVSGGTDFIKHVTRNGVVASIGHSEATFEQANEAVNHGVSHVTHLFNQMSGFHHREPGVVGAAFLNKGLMVEMIVDHVHVHPEAVRAAYQTIGHDRTILITDAMRAKCLPSGTYDLGGQDVIVEGSEARLPNGTLAGSILTLEQAAANMRKNNQLSIEDLVKVTSTNAAKQLGVDDRKGSLQIGKDADIVLLNKEAKVIMTFCKGIIAYDNRGEHDEY